MFWRIASGKEAAASRKPPARAVNVELATAERTAAPVELEAIGEIASSHSVAVRPQLAGTLTRVLFEEGDNVAKGQLLFELDASPFQAAAAQAQAQVEGGRAALLAANAQRARLAPLLEKGYVTPQELETAVAAAQQAEAAVKLAQAQASTAQINLARTRIHAPIAGRTGALAVKSGNLLGVGDATPLVTINQLKPVLAEFSVPQGQLAVVKAALAKGEVKVLASPQDQPSLKAEGTLIFVDNSVDETTGTVRLKARFANTSEQLWPGSFVSLVVTLGSQPDAVVVPESAVQQGAEGAYVFLVGADSKATLKDVVVDRQLKGQVVIAKGLAGGEQLVARPPRELRPGTAVKAMAPQARAAGGADSKASTP